MKKAILLVAFLTLVVFVCGAIAAAPPKAGTTPAPTAPASTKPVKLEKFTGDIKSVDAMAKSMVVAKTKEDKTFVVSGDTKITRGKETFEFEDLKAGMNAVVEYKMDGKKRVGQFYLTSYKIFINMSS